MFIIIECLVETTGGTTKIATTRTLPTDIVPATATLPDAEDVESTTAPAVNTPQTELTTEGEQR